MRSIEPRCTSRDLFHFHFADPDWGFSPWPGSGWSSGMDMSLEPPCDAGHDWEKYWIDLGGEG